MDKSATAVEPVGLALIGAGHMGKCHALAFAAVSGVFGRGPPPRLEMVVDLDADAAARAARDHGFRAHTTEWRDAVADPAVSLVAIAAPNALHRPIALAALAAGKHVYCEKPMATSLRDAVAMAEAAEAAGRVTLLGYNYLRNPAIRHARRLLDEGALGRPFAFRCCFDEDYMADATTPFSWRLRRESAGGGALADLASHVVALAHYLLGPIGEVAGELGIVHGERPRAEGGTGRVENDDVALALVRFRKRFTTEQIIRKLRLAEVKVANDKQVSEAYSQIAVTEQTFVGDGRRPAA